MDPNLFNIKTGIDTFPLNCSIPTNSHRGLNYSKELLLEMKHQILAAFWVTTAWIDGVMKTNSNSYSTYCDCKEGASLAS